MTNNKKSKLFIDVPSGYEYVYQYKDHLGNVRLSYKDVSTTSTPVLEILEENNYYPFGMKHRGYNDVPTAFANPALKFKYNNTEYEEALGLNLYEMDVRSYDPAIARFTSIDPVTHHSQSTYTAFDNNPVYWADPSGADAITFYNDGTEDFADFFKSLQKESAKFNAQNRNPFFIKTGKGTYYNEEYNTYLTFNNRKEIKSKDYIRATGEFSIGTQTKSGGTFLGYGPKTDIGLTTTVASIEILSSIDQTIVNISIADDSESLKEIISSSVITADLNYGFFGTFYERDGEGNSEYSGNISAISLRDGNNGAYTAIKVSEDNTSFGNIGWLDFFGLSYNIEIIFESSGRPKKSVRGQVRSADLEHAKKAQKSKNNGQ